MIGLLQRVAEASVRVEDLEIARIGPGLLVLVAFQTDDRHTRIERLVERLLNYRVFADARGRMNRCLREVGGGLLLVPQFTLAADTDAGNRPSFTPAADPEHGQRLFEELVACARRAWPDTRNGRFGAHMKVALINDGPVTFWLEVRSP